MGQNDRLVINNYELPIDLPKSVREYLTGDWRVVASYTGVSVWEEFESWSSTTEADLGVLVWLGFKLMHKDYKYLTLARRCAAFVVSHNAIKEAIVELVRMIKEDCHLGYRLGLLNFLFMEFLVKELEAREGVKK